jgi:hypothetical protein
MQTEGSVHGDLQEISEQNTARSGKTENSVQGIRTDNEGGIINVHEGVLGRESDNDNAVRQSESVPKAETDTNSEKENKQFGGNVAGESGTTVQASETKPSAERSDNGRSDDDGVRESDDGNGDSGVGARGNDNVDEVKARDFTITKAIAEELDTKAPSMDDNIDAIKVLQDLEKSGKTPTKAQQSTLAKFKGWGGLSHAFWRDRSRLKEIMSDEEISAAQRTIEDAYFTPTNIIDGVVLRIGLSWLFGIAFGLGFYGFVLGYGLASYGYAIPSTVYFLSGKWEKRKVLAEDI